MPPRAREQAEVQQLLNALFALALYIRRTVMLKLFVCIVVDTVGVASFLLPGLGEFADVVWAPFSALFLYFMFENNLRVATVGLFEELMPGLDFVPTATLAWAAENVDAGGVQVVRDVLGVTRRGRPD
eukprot:6730793-Prymnesium_polylepis.1